LDLTSTTCGSIGTDGSSSASLVDFMPGSGVEFIGDLFASGSLVITRDMSDCQVRNVLPDMVEVSESSYMDGRVWSLDGLGCSLTNIVPEGEKIDFKSK